MAVEPNDNARWLRSQSSGPMSQNPDHTETCNRLADAADEIERLQAVENAIVLVLGGVAGGKFLRTRLNETFQQQGRYDGAMSMRCKNSYAREYDAVGAIVERLDEVAAEQAADAAREEGA